MAFIGNTNTTQAFTPAVDFFSGNASTTAFTLSRPVASVAQVQAVISNVPQDPGSAYTVSGSTITFTSAPPSGTNNIYVYYTSPITQVIAPSQGTVGTTQIQNGVTVNFADGSAAAPSITNDGDTNTGIFFPAADTIAFAEGGAEVARFDSSGNLGIGTTSPSSKLHVAGGSGSTIRNTASAGSSWFVGSNVDSYILHNESNTPMLFTTNGTERMRINSSGNVGIGTSSPAVKLDVQADLSANTEIARFSHSTGDIGRGAKISLGVSGYPMAQLEGFADSAGNGSLRFYTYTSTTTTEKMRIDSSGSVLVGTTTNSL